MPLRLYVSPAEDGPRENGAMSGLEGAVRHPDGPELQKGHSDLKSL